ncbi:MAG: GcrA family cell cycle regulator [Methylocystis sp.]|uniref:GcrA family cell cycle regulator n=1 Tax=Methylocystis sp. TaxID=1911079 RepID=UPI003D14A152
MTKTKSPTSPPAPDGGLIQRRQDAARQYMGKQEHSNNWKPLLDSVPVRFMELRIGMCRWPIGDPHDLDTFRFCGCARSSQGAYCETHKKLALAPNRARAFPMSRNMRLPTNKVA